MFIKITFVLFLHTLSEKTLCLMIDLPCFTNTEKPGQYVSALEKYCESYRNKRLEYIPLHLVACSHKHGQIQINQIMKQNKSSLNIVFIQYVFMISKGHKIKII